ncbi:hypothetical protein [Rhodohalobacter sp. 8-1]|uniref:hypothetical protein n=1 Tax=Rhodohalobacter sp. 8-1 TaxID=3131972 RepID=UPI0030EC86C2
MDKRSQCETFGDQGWVPWQRAMPDGNPSLSRLFDSTYTQPGLTICEICDLWFAVCDVRFTIQRLSPPCGVLFIEGGEIERGGAAPRPSSAPSLTCLRQTL